MEFKSNISLNIWYIVSAGGGGGGKQMDGFNSGGGGSGGDTKSNLDKSGIETTTDSNPTLIIKVGNGGSGEKNGEESVLTLPDTNQILCSGGKHGGNATLSPADSGSGGNSAGDGSGSGAKGSTPTPANAPTTASNGLLIPDNDIFNSTKDRDASYYYGWGGAGGDYQNQSKDLSKYGIYGTKDDSQSSVDPTTSKAETVRTYGGGGGKGQSIISDNDNQPTLGDTGSGVQGAIIIYYKASESSDNQ